MNEKKRRRVTLLSVVKIVFTVFLIVIVLFPLIWMAVGSFKLERRSWDIRRLFLERNIH